jgi:Protein of unknown function (DUF1810)
MWLIFPQLVGLGHSPTALRYAIQDLDQAKRYLADPILGGRLRQDVRLIIGYKDKSAFEIFGSPDHLKLRSCLTLFAEAASDSADRALFELALHHIMFAPHALLAGDDSTVFELGRPLSSIDLGALLALSRPQCQEISKG